MEPLEQRLMMSAAPKAAITVTSNSTVYPEQTINVQALASTWGSGDVLHDTIAWNFGDAGAAYNTLVGFNAAHAYANAGAYTITLTVTAPDGQSSITTDKISVSTDTRKNIYVSTSGNDGNNGLSTSTPIQSIARANQLMGSNTRILFQRGDTFSTTNPEPLIDNGYQNVYFGAYGSGANPILKYTGPKVLGTIIGATNGAVGMTVQGLTFDSIYTNNKDIGTIPVAITPAGSNISILNNTFYNVEADVALQDAPNDVLISGNSSPSATGLQGYFVWVQGNDIAIVGNTVANSDGESTVRIGGANRVLIAENSLTDTLKASVAIQLGSYAYVYDNVAPAGVMGVGPLYNTLPSSLDDPSGQFNDCVFDSNQIWGSILVQPAAHYTMMRNNVLHVSGGDGFVINATTSVFPNRQAQFIWYLNNTVIDTSNQGGFLFLNAGQALDVTVDNNLFVDPIFGNGSSVIYVDDNNLNSFSQILDNIWPNTKATVFYVNTVIGVAKSYLTPTEWEAMGVPKGDVFSNVLLPTNVFDATLDGFTAGSTVGSATPAPAVQTAGSSGSSTSSSSSSSSSSSGSKISSGSSSIGSSGASSGSAAAAPPPRMPGS